MPRGKRFPGQRGTDGEAQAEAAKIWYMQSNSSAEGVRDWDLKPGRLESAILGVLGNGHGIMFGVTRDGGAVSVTIYAGEDKQRKYCSDSIELDDLLDLIAIAANPRPPTELRAPKTTLRETGD